MVTVVKGTCTAGLAYETILCPCAMILANCARFMHTHTHHVGCTSTNQGRLDLDLPSYVPGGSELGGDDMCSVCMDRVR